MNEKEKLIAQIKELKIRATKAHWEAIQLGWMNCYWAWVENGEIYAYNNVLELLWVEI